MQLSFVILLFSAVIAATVASPYGEYYGPEINNAAQTSTALSGDGGVSIASGSANAGGRESNLYNFVLKVKRLAPAFELADDTGFRQGRAFTTIVGGPNAGQVVFV